MSKLKKLKTTIFRPKLPCPLCGHIFNSTADLNNHFKTVHELSSDDYNNFNAAKQDEISARRSSMLSAVNSTTYTPNIISTEWFPGKYLGLSKSSSSKSLRHNVNPNRATGYPFCKKITEAVVRYIDTFKKPLDKVDPSQAGLFNSLLPIVTPEQYFTQEIMSTPMDEACRNCFSFLFVLTGCMLDNKPSRADIPLNMNIKCIRFLSRLITFNNPDKKFNHTIINLDSDEGTDMGLIVLCIALFNYYLGPYDSYVNTKEMLSAKYFTTINTRKNLVYLCIFLKNMTAHLDHRYININIIEYLYSFVMVYRTILRHADNLAVEILYFDQDDQDSITANAGSAYGTALAEQSGISEKLIKSHIGSVTTNDSETKIKMEPDYENTDEDETNFKQAFDNNPSYYVQIQKHIKKLFENPTSSRPFLKSQRHNPYGRGGSSKYKRRKPTVKRRSGRPRGTIRKKGTRTR